MNPNENEDICPKCGKEGCTCGPECDCTEAAQADITQQKRSKKVPPA